MKRLAFIALLGFLAALLIACGNQPAETGIAPETPPSPAASPETDTEASPAASPEASPAAETSPTGDALPDLGGRKIVIGTDATYPPFEYVDPETNEIVGFDVDLMNEIAKLINIEPEFQNAAFDTIFTALQSGQFDAVMSAATITEERKKIVAFSYPYVDVGQLVVVRTENDDIQGYEDLDDGAIVGVQTGTTGEIAALEEANVPDNNLRRYQTIDLAFADLANGTIDAVVADNPTASNYTTQPQYQGKLKIVGEPFTEESYGIAVQQEDTELLNAINVALEQLKENGTIDRLKEKYQIK
jgi:polar amino acid transport system substrate-binding protein